MKNKIPINLLLVIFAFYPLSADVVFLKNGEKIEGKVQKKNNGEVIIELDFGSIGIPENEILKIQKKEDKPQRVPDNTLPCEDSAQRVLQNTLPCQDSGQNPENSKHKNLNAQNLVGCWKNIETSPTSEAISYEDFFADNSFRFSGIFKSEFYTGIVMQKGTWKIKNNRLVLKNSSLILPNTFGDHLSIKEKIRQELKKTSTRKPTAITQNCISYETDRADSNKLYTVRRLPAENQFGKLGSEYCITSIRSTKRTNLKTKADTMEIDTIRHWIRPLMARIDYGRDVTYILRLDLNLILRIDHKKKRYRSRYIPEIKELDFHAVQDVPNINDRFGVTVDKSPKPHMVGGHSCTGFQLKMYLADATIISDLFVKSDTTIPLDTYRKSLFCHFDQVFHSPIYFDTLSTIDGIIVSSTSEITTRQNFSSQKTTLLSIEESAYTHCRYDVPSGYFNFQQLNSLDQRKHPRILLEHSKSRYPSERYWSLVVISYSKFDFEAEVLIHALHDNQDKIRRYALSALHNVTDNRIVPLAIELLSTDTSRWVREQAAVLLGKKRDPSALKALKNALYDKGYPVKYKAIHALFSYNNKEATDMFFDYLRENVKERKLIEMKILQSKFKKDFNWDLKKWITWWDENKNRLYD